MFVAGSKSKKQSGDSNWTLLAIVLVALGLFLIVAQDEKGEKNFGSQAPTPVEVRADLEDRIDVHLKSADVRTDLESERAVMGIPAFNDQQTKVEDFDRPLPLDRKQSVHSVDVTRQTEANDLERRPLTPAELIERGLANEQFLREYDKKHRQKYVEEFLRNAQEQGLDVELNEDLEVTAVKRRQTEKTYRNPDSVGGSPGASK